MAFASADAARACYAETKKLEGAALAGTQMVAMGLAASGDPVGIRKNLAARVDLWLAVTKHAASGQQLQHAALPAIAAAVCEHSVRPPQWDPRDRVERELRVHRFVR